MTRAAETLREAAPAKINLFLQICGKRADGYHLLDSLVVFAAVGDEIAAEDSEQWSLDIDGPFAGSLSAGDDNLVLRAARYLAARRGGPAGAALRLTKNLPVASGIGGGSSDAAAAIRACARLWDLEVERLDAGDVAQALGADVPVCLARKPTRMTGIGETLSPAPPLPPFALVLANPRIALSTATVFKALGGRHSGKAAALPDSFADVRDFAVWLNGCTNDLMAPAREQLPVIRDVIAALTGTNDCLLARLSGSGPTCFGLYPTLRAAENAAAFLQKSRPDWWVAAAAQFA